MHRARSFFFCAGLLCLAGVSVPAKVWCRPRALLAAHAKVRKPGLRARVNPTALLVVESIDSTSALAPEPFGVPWATVSVDGGKVRLVSNEDGVVRVAMRF